MEVVKDLAQATQGKVAVSFVAPNVETPARMWKHLFVSIILQL